MEGHLLRHLSRPALPLLWERPFPCFHHVLQQGAAIFLPNLPAPRPLVDAGMGMWHKWSKQPFPGVSSSRLEPAHLGIPEAAAFPAVGRKAARGKEAERREGEWVPSASWFQMSQDWAYPLVWSHPTHLNSPFDYVSQNLFIFTLIRVRISRLATKRVLPDALIKIVHRATF